MDTKVVHYVHPSFDYFQILCARKRTANDLISGVFEKRWLRRNDNKEQLDFKKLKCSKAKISTVFKMYHPELRNVCSYGKQNMEAKLNSLKRKLL